MSLAWELEVLPTRAAVFMIPLPLIDRHGVPSPDVGQIEHVAPNEDGSIRVELEEIEPAEWIRCRVGRVRLHPAVGAPVLERLATLAFLVRVDRITSLLHVPVVLDHIFVALVALLRALALLPFWRAVSASVFSHILVLVSSRSIARDEGQNCKVSHCLFFRKFNMADIFGNLFSS